ncbi:MAG TPA: hypothetical protein PKL31_08315 [Fulvivirga sp.]|nr:hypothetical protein [Fulvivirga sp.]
MKKLIYLCLAVGTIACSNIKSEKVAYYFSVDSLNRVQAQILLDNKAKLFKFAVVNGDTTTTTFTPDSLQWADEFQVFNHADINKPAMKGNYKISVYNDTQSNLKVKSYEAISKGTAVQSLQLYFLDNIEKLKKLEMVTHEKNSIYNSTKHLNMEFDEVKGGLRLTSYTITGYQKMILMDTVKFYLKGELRE